MSVVEANEAPSLDVEGVNVVFATLLGLGDVPQSRLDVAVAETAPGQVLVHSHVLVVQREGGFKGPLGLLEVFLLLIKETDLDESVHFLLDGEGAGQN